MTSYLNRPVQEEYKNKILKTVLSVILSICVLLIIMAFWNLFFSGVVNTILNITSLFAAVFVLFKTLKINKLLGDKTFLFTTIAIILIVMISVIFSKTFIFDEVIIQEFGSIEHNEHDLMYSQMKTIASRLSEGMSIEQATDGLRLEQYHNIFVYSSFMFLAGGANITNMSIWGMMHVVIFAVLLVLACYSYGIKEKEKLQVVYFFSLLQPILLSVHTYNKVIVGQAFVALAIYIYVKTYKRPIHNILCFPVYAWLLWSVRLQYLLIAIALCILMFFINKNKLTLAISIEFLTVVFVFIVLFATTDVMGFVNQELNVENYTEGSNYSLILMPMRLLRSILSYFPFTQIFEDDNWTFNIYCMPQVAVNAFAWITIATKAIKGKQLKNMVCNPMVIAAAGFLFASLFSDLHTTYSSVGTALLVSEFDDIKGKNIITRCIYIFVAILAVSIIYHMMGLVGTNASGIIV